MKPCNIHRAGSVKYYRDQLYNIWAVTLEYDGCKTTNQLKKLIDELGDMAKSALDKKTLYFKS